MSRPPARRPARRSGRRPAVRSLGPDAVHLCLTVGDAPHAFGCAWASYGEPRRPAPASGASRARGLPRRRVRRLALPITGLPPS